MSKRHAHFLSVLLPASALVVAGLVLVPTPVRAQRAQSRLTPIIVHPGAESLGSSLRLSHERLDLSTITREDTSLRVGRELVQGESVGTLRLQKAPGATPTERERRQQVIREQDDLRHKRMSVIYDD